MQQKKARLKLSGLIAGKVEVVEKVNWECRVVSRRLELVDAAPDPVATKKSRKHR